MQPWHNIDLLIDTWTLLVYFMPTRSFSFFAFFCTNLKFQFAKVAHFFSAFAAFFVLQGRTKLFLFFLPFFLFHLQYTHQSHIIFLFMPSFYLTPPFFTHPQTLHHIDSMSSTRRTSLRPSPTAQLSETLQDSPVTTPTSTGTPTTATTTAALLPSSALLAKNGTIIVTVTGATGYLGEHLVKSLLEQGYQVRGTVRNVN